MRTYSTAVMFPTTLPIDGSAMLNQTQWPELMLRGTSTAAQKLRLQVERVAPHFRTAVLVGEAGCWKEQIARSLTARSPLRDYPFLAQAAETFESTSIEFAHPVTLYLASIGDLPLEQQILLARRLQPSSRRRTEVRLICSSEVAPRGLLAAGRMHPELHRCVGTVEIRVAPLRERLDDLPALLQDCPLHATSLARLREHHWPGNFQELHAVLTGATVHAQGGLIEPEHLPELRAISPVVTDDGDVRLDVVLRRHVYAVLEGCDGNKLRAAEMLGISRSTLYRMLDT